MKKIEAEVRKERLPDVDSALRRLGVSGLTVSEQNNRGRFTYPLENIRRVLVTVVVDDPGASRVVQSIRETASTGSWGDGTIAVTSLDGAYDIGSGRADVSNLLNTPLS